MNRVIVLVLCLASAAGIAGYTYVSGERGEATAVYLAPKRSPEPKPEPPAATSIDPGDRVGLARALQRELKRVGCYGGEITGAWTTSSRMAMKAFTERVNATLPTDKPDPVLLSLVQGHRDKACGTACPAGQAPTGNGVCMSDAVPAKAARSAAGSSGPEQTAAATAKAGTRPGPPAGAAATPALTAPAAKPVLRTKSGAADEAAPAAVEPAPPDGRARDKKGVADAPRSGPVPSEGMREKRPRPSDKTATSRPPKIVRDVLQALGF